jgi:hypothetical protein
MAQVLNQTSLAKSLGMPLFMANTALQVYQMGKAMGLGDNDGAAIVQLYEQWTGVQVTARTRYRAAAARQTPGGTRG